MSQKKRLGLFATEEFQELIEQVAVKGKTVVVPHATIGHAQVLRNDFYQYRKLLRADGKIEQANLADYIVARLTTDPEHGPAVTFLPRSSYLPARKDLYYL